MHLERRRIEQSGTGFAYFDPGSAGSTGATITESRASDRIVLPLHQTAGVSEPSDQLVRALARTVHEILAAEAIRRHRDWIVAWFDGASNLSAEKSKLLLAMDNLFSEHPVEDGVIHPAERLLETWLARLPSDGAAVLADVVGADAYHYRAELLRCIGRLPYNKVYSRAGDMLRTALRSDDVELRDAAIRAFELWDEASLTGILREHRETDPWLRDYLERILASQ